MHLMSPGTSRIFLKCNFNGAEPLFAALQWFPETRKDFGTDSFTSQNNPNSLCGLCLSPECGFFRRVVCRFDNLSNLAWPPVLPDVFLRPLQHPVQVPRFLHPPHTTWLSFSKQPFLPQRFTVCSESSELLELVGLLRLRRNLVFSVSCILYCPWLAVCKVLMNNF